MHFWPALAVISRTTSRTNRSNSGLPGPASGPSTRAFSESASALKRTLRPTTAGCARSRAAVAAEPVKRQRVLPGQPVEQPRRAADEQLQRAVREQAGVDHLADRVLGHVRGLARPA